MKWQCQLITPACATGPTIVCATWMCIEPQISVVVLIITTEHTHFDRIKQNNHGIIGCKNTLLSRCNIQASWTVSPESWRSMWADGNPRTVLIQQAVKAAILCVTPGTICQEWPVSEPSGHRPCPIQSNQFHAHTASIHLALSHVTVSQAWRLARNQSSVTANQAYPLLSHTGNHDSNES